MSAVRSITAAELAQRVAGRLEGDGDRVISGVGTLEEATPDMLSWLARPELLSRWESSRAGVVLAPLNCAAPPGRTVIRVPDPDLTMCDVLRWFTPPPESVPGGVHPTAVVAEGAVVAGAAIGPHAYVGASAIIGPNTQLHAGVCVGAEARIGRDCVLWPNVVVRERVTVGDRVIIHPNATIGADGFGYLQREGRHVKIPQTGTVVIEDDVEIGANACIDRARSGVTRIGRGTKIDNLVQIGHNVSVGEHCIIVAQCGISGSSSLGRQVVLAGAVGVSDHVHIGHGAVVKGRAGVQNDLPPGRVYRGNPACEDMQSRRQIVATRRLPALVQEFRELVRRVERLESAADHSTRS